MTYKHQNIYYFSTRHGNPKKAELLEKLASRLNVTLKVDVSEL